MRKMSAAFCLSILLLAILCSCGSSGGTARGKVNLAIQGSQPQAASGTASGARAAAGTPISLTVIGNDGSPMGTITLTDARISLKNIELDMAESELDSEEELLENEEIDFAGPFIVNLLTNAITPELPLADLYQGTYEEIELDMDRYEGQDIPSSDPLYGKSLYLKGEYDDGSTTTAITISYDADEEFELTGTDGTSLGFTVDGSLFNNIIIAFRMNKWFHFNDAETNPGLAQNFAPTLISGEFLLDKVHDQAIFEVIKENIEESADYGEDLDGNGTLESDEDDDPDSEDGEDN